MGSNSWKENCVDNFCKSSGSSVDGSQSDLFHKLAFDPRDVESAFGVIGFTDHDAVISWKIVVLFVKNKITLEVAEYAADSFIQAETRFACCIGFTLEHLLAFPLRLSYDDLHWFLQPLYFLINRDDDSFDGVAYLSFVLSIFFKGTRQVL